MVRKRRMLIIISKLMIRLFLLGFYFVILGCSTDNTMSDSIRYPDPFQEAFKGKGISYLVYDEDSSSRVDTIFLDSTGMVKYINGYWHDEERTYNDHQFITNLDVRDFDIHSRFSISYDFVGDSIIQNWREIDHNGGVEPVDSANIVIFKLDLDRRIKEEIDRMRARRTMFDYDNRGRLNGKRQFSTEDGQPITKEIFIYDSLSRIEKIKQYAGQNLLILTHYYSNGILDSTVYEELKDSLNYSDRVVRYKYVYRRRR